MSLRKARNPNTIFREMVKSSLNAGEQSTYFLYRGMVTAIDTVGNVFSENCPPNTIKVRIFKPQINTNDSSEYILWPYDEYDLKPIFPYEVVLCLFEDNQLNFGYWTTRLPGIDKSYLPASETITVSGNAESESSLQAFGVENNSEDRVPTEEDLVSSSENFQQEIDKWRRFKKVVKFDKREQDRVIFCKNTSRIVLGNDRLNTKDSGNSEGEAIDVVVGVNNQENGNPDFIKDASRIYISSKTNQIDGAENTENEGVVYVKSDNICLVGRKDFVIKSEDGQITIKINRDSTLSIKTNGKVSIESASEIEIKAGTSAKMESATKIDISAPSINLNGSVNATSITSPSISAGAMTISGGTTISLPSGQVNLAGINDHIHTVPPAPVNPVVSGPPISP